MTILKQAQERTVKANGITIGYLDWGNETGTPMVLLHGLRGHRHSWDDFSSAMCGEYRVLALDQRGRGLPIGRRTATTAWRLTWPTWPASVRRCR